MLAHLYLESGSTILLEYLGRLNNYVILENLQQSYFWCPRVAKSLKINKKNYEVKQYNISS